MLAAASPYIRLMRLHQRAGIYLLLWPCLWSLTLASGGFPSPRLCFLFVIGSVIMRSAGCIINDMADRKLDAQVERTCTRPLASGELNMMQASLLLAFLLIVAAIIAIMLGWPVFLGSIAALPLVAAYPFMKRITWWPQLFLGFTFNWGALLGWIAVRGELNLPALLLYLGGICWTLGYDTVYGHQDKRDDVKAGIKSTALLFERRTKTVLCLCYAMAILFWCSAALAISKHFILLYFFALPAFHFAWQVYTVRLDSPNSCRNIFISNIYIGWLVWLAYLALST